MSGGEIRPQQLARHHPVARTIQPGHRKLAGIEQHSEKARKNITSEKMNQTMPRCLEGSVHLGAVKSGRRTPG